MGGFGGGFGGPQIGYPLGGLNKFKKLF